MLVRMMALTALFFAGYRRPLRSRDRLGFWYDGAREGRAVDV
jgi:hypothetical protein